MPSLPERLGFASGKARDARLVKGWCGIHGDLEAEENSMDNDHVKSLKRSRAKLVEQRRALVKRDCSTDRNEGFAERIIAIQTALDATDRAIRDEASADVSEAAAA